MKNAKIKAKKNKSNFFKKLDKKTKAMVITSISVIIVCIVVILGFVLKDAFRRAPNSEPVGSESFELESVFVNPFSDKVVNFLLCGVDIDSTTGRKASLPDVMIVASFNMEKNEVNMLQIPRDTFAGDDVATGKMNAVYSTAPQGAKANRLIARINSMFGIAIDYYVVTTMEALKMVVDGLGGFEMDVPASINLDGVHVDKGLQTIDGTKAAAIIRNRYNNGSKTEYYYNGGDIRRLETQQILIKAFAKKILSSPVSFVLNVVPDVYPLLETDISLADLKDYIKVAMNLDVENINMFVLPGSSCYHNGLSIYNLDANKTVDILNKYFRYLQDPITTADVNIPYGKPDSFVNSSTVEDPVDPDPNTSSGSSGGILDDLFGNDSSSDSSSETENNSSEESSSIPEGSSSVPEESSSVPENSSSEAA